MRHTKSTPTDPAAIKNALLRELAKLHRDVDRLELLEVRAEADELDQVQSEAERDVAIERFDREAKISGAIHAALQKLDSGSYGICDKCETRIPAKRLKAIPWALYCLRCQEQQESPGLEAKAARTDAAAA